MYIYRLQGYYLNPQLYDIIQVNYELYQDGILKLDPDFQRQYVWNSRKRKSRLIESLMLRIPIPAFYFFEKNDGSFLVIDGQQRLKTIFDFLDGKFSLYGMEYLGEKYDKKKFDDLDPKATPHNCEVIENMI